VERLDQPLADGTLADTRAQLTAQWDVRGLDLATITDDGGTVHATRKRLVRDVPMAQTLPPLLDALDGHAAPFRLGRTLGQGGMGLVRAATQIALGREVAVKALKPDADPRNAAQLLREALVTGALEHPNIVPVHALGRDEQGRPMIVMKRVDGVGWDVTLAREAAERGEESFLKKHLGVLVQVARAAHFAHQRGIVHRDIKPANVMFGPHDEIYLVDWGIAVSLRADGVQGVPLASNSAALEGTPAYMAPEMAAAAGELIDERTDVYLLGATLHEVLTGAAPHDGDKLLDVLTLAFASAPMSYRGWVPQGLVDICHRAMSREADDRHPSAAAFAQDLERVLERRALALLADEAAERLDELDAAAGRAAELEPGELQALYMLYSECRFAFTHVLSGWADNERARDGLERAVAAMVRMELRREAPEAAELLLLDLPHADAELEAEVAAALRTRERQGARLEQLARDTDLRVGVRQRARFAGALGLFWLVLLVALGQIDRAGWLHLTHAHVAGVYGACLIAALASILALRSALKNRASRRQVFGIVLLYLSYFVIVPVCWRLGLDLPGTTVISITIGTVAFSCATFFFDRSLVPMPLVLVLGLAAALAWPSFHLEAFGVSGALGAWLSAWNMARAATGDAATSQPFSR
jgi:eukaryotic-like serine/threonine-protein kinase